MVAIVELDDDFGKVFHLGADPVQLGVDQRAVVDLVDFDLGVDGINAAAVNHRQRITVHQVECGLGFFPELQGGFDHLVAGQVERCSDDDLAQRAFHRGLLFVVVLVVESFPGLHLHCAANSPANQHPRR